jgi:hypothetical protein
VVVGRQILRGGGWGNGMVVIFSACGVSVGDEAGSW